MCLLYYYRKRRMGLSWATASAAAAGVTKCVAAADPPRATELGRCVAVKRTIARHRRSTPYPVDRPSHVASRACRRRVVRLLLNRVADPNARNARRKTAVRYRPSTSHRRHRQIIGLLVGHRFTNPVDAANSDALSGSAALIDNEKRYLDAFMDCNVPKDDINKAFYKAATQDNTMLMNKLLNRGADIEYEDQETGFTALLTAAKSKYVRATQFLLEKGANPTVHDSLKWTCLHLVVYYGFPYRILVTMLEKHAERREQLIELRTCNQETALHLAAERGNDAAAYLLLRAGASTDAVDCKSRTPLLTALHWHRDTVARFIVSAGASVNRVPGSAWPPLHAAVARNDSSLVQLLLEQGAVVVDPRDDDLDRTIIHEVCESGDAEMLKRLLAYTGPGALQALHERGRPQPPLVVAASAGHGSVVGALLARGVDVNARRADGETALHAAVRANSAALVDQLLHAGARVDARDAVSGRRPLDVAVYTWGRYVAVTAQLVHTVRMTKAVIRHDVDAVRFLLACGVSPNVTTEAYGTPLHAAVRHRRYRMIAVILTSSRCRPDVRHNGVTPLDFAVAMGDSRATKMLLWHNLRRRTRHLSLSPRDRRDEGIPSPSSNHCRRGRRTSI